MPARREWDGGVSAVPTRDREYIVRIGASSREGRQKWDQPVP